MRASLCTQVNQLFVPSGCRVQQKVPAGIAVELLADEVRILKLQFLGHQQLRDMWQRPSSLQCVSEAGKCCRHYQRRSSQ